MTKSLKDYIQIYSPTNPVLSDEDISSLIWGDGEWSDSHGHLVNYQNCGMSFCSNQAMYIKLTEWAKDCCTKYSTHQKFSIVGGSAPRFNRYKVGECMEKHVDHIYSCFDGTRRGIPVLSIIGILNEDYEGGELTFYLDDEVYAPKLKTGDTLVFPSAFPWQHEVKPVTSGTRYTWVTWAW